MRIRKDIIWMQLIAIFISINTISQPLPWDNIVGGGPGSAAAGGKGNNPCTQQGVQFHLKAFLEGPFTGSEMSNDLIVLSEFPLAQPYNVPPWNYFGTEQVITLPNSNIVDWVLIEIRQTTGNAASAISDSALARQAGFLLKNGDITDVGGNDSLEFNIAVSANLYVVIYHRNHLGIMSAIPLTATGSVYSYDFTTGSGQAFSGSNGQKHLGNNYYGMYAADGDANGQVQNADKVEIWYMQSGSSGYLSGDYNLDGQVNSQDKIERWLPNGGHSRQVPQ